MKWKTTNACVRGSSHIRSGAPNQDSAQTTLNEHGIAVAAVADGHGSARHFRSHIGSSLAVSTAVTLVQDFLTGRPTIDDAAIDTLQHQLVDKWTTSVLSDLAHNPFSEAELAAIEAAETPESRASVVENPLLAYGATLLIAAATDTQLLYLQLGDGEILQVTASGETTRPLPPDDRLVGNATTSLCQPEAWHDFRSATVTAPSLPALVLLSTDGYANSFRSDEDFLKIGQDYLAILREQGISLLAEELPEILGEATQQGSGDDITLALLQGDLRSPDAGAPVKPKLTPASRSALIDQLKARHSSQQHRLEELSTRVDKAHKDNRRLKLLMAALLIVAIGLALFFFRSHLFPINPPADPAHPPHGLGRDHDKDKDKDKAVTSGDAPATLAPTEWLLVLNDGNQVTLKKGTEVQRRKVFPDAPDARHDAPFARVAELGGRIILINDSPENWTIGKKDNRIPNGNHLTLGNDPVTITFAPNVTGKITAIAVVPQSPEGLKPDSPADPVVSPRPALAPTDAPPRLN